MTLPPKPDYSKGTTMTILGGNVFAYPVGNSERTWTLFQRRNLHGSVRRTLEQPGGTQ